MSGASTGKASKGTGTPGDAISASRNREPVIFQLLNGKSKTVENSGKICGEDFDLPEQFHGPLAQVDIRPAGCHLTLLTVPIEVPSRENLTGLLGQLQSWFSPRPRISLSQPTAFLNDRPLKLSEQVRLQDADELRIGNYRFRIHMNAAAHVGSPE